MESILNEAEKRGRKEQLRMDTFIAADQFECDCDGAIDAPHVCLRCKIIQAIEEEALISPPVIKEKDGKD